MSDNIFAKAANILMEKGHCKGVLEDETGAHCAMGALNVAAHGDSGWKLIPGGGFQFDADQYSVRVAAKLDEKGIVTPEDPFGPNVGSRVVAWNNAPETTAEDVIMIFKELGAER